jgi:prepilin-type N-terminal cleavage/methylation domain-containing protein
LGSRNRGFTLLEVVFAIAILTIGGLMLTVALSSSERMNSLARERAVANNVIRAYIERQRGTYPAAGSTDMVPFVLQSPSSTVAANHACVPTFDLYQMYTHGTVERTVLKNVSARVSMCTWEDGNSFGPVYTTNAAIAAATTGSNTMGADDRNALGFPRDLNANGTIDTGAGNDTISLQNGASPANIIAVPVKIELFWVSGSTANGVNAGNRQSMTVYAILSSAH